VQDSVSVQLTNIFSEALCVGARVSTALTEVAEECGVEARVEARHRARLRARAKEACHPWHAHRQTSAARTRQGGHYALVNISQSMEVTGLL